MKYYKLVNDIPMFKKGDLFFIHPEEGCLLQKDTLRLAYHKETLEKNPEILKNWFEEVEESENKRWRAKYGKKYWYLCDYGIAFSNTECGNDIDDFIYSLIVKDYRTTYTFSCYFPGVIYFRTGKALKKSLKIHKAQWEIVRKYEMGEM